MSNLQFSKEIDKIIGATVCWNQLVKDFTYTSWNFSAAFERVIDN